MNNWKDGEEEGGGGGGGEGGGGNDAAVRCRADVANWDVLFSGFLIMNGNETQGATGVRVYGPVTFITSTSIYMLMK